MRHPPPQKSHNELKQDVLEYIIFHAPVLQKKVRSAFKEVGEARVINVLNDLEDEKKVKRVKKGMKDQRVNYIILPGQSLRWDR